MITIGEEELICDLAETYNIYNYQSLPVKLVAIFSCGLRENSRIKKKLRLSDPYEDISMEMLVAMYDKLNLISWQIGGNEDDRPESLFQKLYPINKEPEAKPMKFSTGKDFKEEWKRRMM